jgi:predicted metal-dependent peptidase
MRKPNPELPEILQYARLKLLKERPYLAHIVFRMVPVPTPGLGTLAVDRWWRFYYDPQIHEKMTAKEAVAAIYHEVHHILRQHATRHAWMSEQNPQLANICTDLSINSDIREERWETEGVRLPDWVLQPEQFKLPPKQTPEEYWDALQQQQQQGQGQGQGQGQQAPGQQSSGGGKGKGKGAGKGAGKGSGGQSGSQSPGAGGRAQGPGSGSSEGHAAPGAGGCGSCAGGPRREWELPSPGESGVDGVGQIEGEVILGDVAREIAEHARGRGNVPGSLKRWAEQFVQPAKVDWRKLLASYIRRAAATRYGSMDYSFRRTSHRAAARGIIQPGLVTPDPTVAVVLDTSGSMGQKELQAALSEVQGILRSLGLRELTLLDVDAKAHRARKVSTLRRIEALGGGGTDMRVGIDAALKLKPRPEIIIVLTDGYTPWPDAAPSVPVVVGLVAGDMEVPKWAKKVVVEQ